MILKIYHFIILDLNNASTRADHSTVNSFSEVMNEEKGGAKEVGIILEHNCSTLFYASTTLQFNISLQYQCYIKQMLVSR